MTSKEDHVADLQLDPNEASGLQRVSSPELLERYGWDLGLWSVLDEVDASECIVLLGHKMGAPMHEGWSSRRLRAERVGHDGPVQDAEAVADWDGWVYVFGSHHGHKAGPIRRKVQWVARFQEAAVTGGVEDEPTVPLTVVHTDLQVHRLLNDALLASDLDLMPMTDAMNTEFIDATIAKLEGTAAEGRVRPGDWTVNIEGADFTDDGALLLGLRFPIGADGSPLIVQLSDWDGLFEDPLRLPTVDAIWQVDAIGRNGSLAGVRDLCTVGDALHVVTGDLDSAGKGSIIRKEYSGGAETVSTHVSTQLSGTNGGRVKATFVREFADNPRIEGVAADQGGRFFYVSDEDDSVSLRSTPLLTEQ